MRIKTAISLVLTLYIYESFLFCQVVDDPDIKIENINFYILNDQMNINYDLVNARPKDKFSVAAKIITESGDVLDSPSLIGHVGDNLSAGNWLNNYFSRDLMYSVFKSTKHTRKNIIWDLSKDLTTLNDNIYVELTAVHTNPRYFRPTGKAGALIFSTVWPGWGSYRTRFRQEHLYRGMFAYLFAAGSYHYYSLTKESYDKYLVQVTSEGRDQFYSDTERYFRNYKGLMYAAISMWAVDYANILLFDNLSQKSGYRTGITLNDVNGVKIPAVSLVHNF